MWPHRDHDEWRAALHRLAAPSQEQVRHMLTHALAGQVVKVITFHAMQAVLNGNEVKTLSNFKLKSKYSVCIALNSGKRQLNRVK